MEESRLGIEGKGRCLVGKGKCLKAGPELGELSADILGKGLF